MHTKLWWAIIVLSILITSVASIGYVNGYRIGPNITLIKTHTLTITDIPVGAYVFADYAPRGKSSGNTFSIPLVPGTHMILVTAKNYSPWTSLVTVPDDTDTKVQALTVPKDVSGDLLSGDSARKAREIIAKEKLPSLTQPLILDEGCVLISVNTENNDIIATPTTTPECAPPKYFCINGTCATTVIYSPKIAPVSVIAYPKRQDALIMLIGKNLYAISLDPRNPRTLSLILHGIAPHVATLPNGDVVVSDQSSVYTLNL